MLLPIAGTCGDHRAIVAIHGGTLAKPGTTVKVTLGPGGNSHFSRGRGGPAYESPPHFVCEKSQAEKKPCKFSVGKTILQQPIEVAQLQKLLAGEKTDLLTKFVSSKTGRPFQAFLVMDEKGKVTFDFPPRDGDADAAKAPAKT